jgi:uncharacterized protein (TIGR03435 family)
MSQVLHWAQSAREDGIMLRRIHIEQARIFAARRNHRSGLLLLGVACVGGIVAAVSPAAFAQGSAPATTAVASPAHAEASGADKRSFEAASVRPGPKFVAKGWDFLDPVNKAAPDSGLFSWNTPVGNMIAFAYDLRSSQVKSAMWKELPTWAQDEWYTVEARADGVPSREDVRQMVRSLLEERFKLAVHAGTHEGQVNALTVVRTGVGLKPHADGAPCEVAMPPADGAYPAYKNFPVRCGIFNRELSRYKRRIEMVNVTMAQIADTLSGNSPLPVVDATGLTGRYDGFLDYGPGMLPPDADPAAEVGLPVAAALEKQLGLKLVKQNAAVDDLVIDHIETPTEN